MSDVPDTMSGAQRVVLGLFFATLLALLFAAAMGRNLNHDEHQFLAPGALLSREGFQPYRDYPLFHLPHLTFVYAGLNLLWDRPMWMARAFSAVCAFALALVIFREAWKTPAFGNFRWRTATAAGAALLLLLDPLFAFTTGRAWNHDLPALLIVLAIVWQVKAATKSPAMWSVASAICAGLAAGTRLTYAPILIPLWAAVWIFPLPLRQRFALAGLYIAAATLALAPSLSYLVAHREQFLFGNFEFPRLRLLDPDNERIRKTMHPLRKLRFFFKEVALPSLPLFLAFSAFAIQPVWAWVRRRGDTAFGAALTLAVIPFALLGCFAPSRYQYQHFFIVTPLLVLGVVFGAGRFSTTSIPCNRPLIAFSIFVITNCCLGIYEYRGVWSAKRIEDWFPNRIRASGERIRTFEPKGPILTLAPAYPLEAGLRIYPEFATAPFAWKSARFVTTARRERFKLIAPDDLDALLSARPPGGILTGVEEETLEKPLVEYARSHGFRAIKLEKKQTIWLPSPGS